MAKILVIEDNEPLQRMYRRRLKEHELHVVATGLAALDLLQEGQFDLIISDGDLEGPLTGIDVWIWLSLNRSDLLPKFVFCSGSIEVSAFCEKRDIKFHEKEDASTLFKTVRDMLEKNRCSSSDISGSCSSTTSSPSTSNSR